MIVTMPYPFFLSYARKDANVGGAPAVPDPHFKAFLLRLNQRVQHLTGALGFVDYTNIQSGQDWPDELAEALRTAQTMVCLYSPSYFGATYCGKEMQVLLDRRLRYIRTNAGKKPANIIPVLWHSTARRIPKSLPDIQYQAPNLDPDKHGAWDLGDLGRKRDLNAFADQIALRIRDAGDETPLPPLAERPRMDAVRSAFEAPPLPLQEFGGPESPRGPDAVTFVYADAPHWSSWPWSPPNEQAVLYLAAAVAKGKEMHSTQLTFNVAAQGFGERLAALRQSNNVVILLLDAASLDLANIVTCLPAYDQPDCASFATIVIADNNHWPQHQVKLQATLPYFAKRAPPYFCCVDDRRKFVDVVAEVLDALRLAVVRDPQQRQSIGGSSTFVNLPTVTGPGQLPSLP